MKKIFLLTTFFLITLLINAQDTRPPQRASRGLSAPIIVLDTLSTVSRDALLYKNFGSIIYHKDTGISRHEYWNGSAWVSFGDSNLLETISNPLGETYFGNRLKPITQNEGLWFELGNDKSSGVMLNLTDITGTNAYASYGFINNSVPYTTGGGMILYGSAYNQAYLQDNIALWSASDLYLQGGNNASDIVFSLGNKVSNSIAAADQDEVLKFNADRTVLFPELTTALVTLGGAKSVVIKEAMDAAIAAIPVGGDLTQAVDSDGYSESGTGSTLQVNVGSLSVGDANFKVTNSTNNIQSTADNIIFAKQTGLGNINFDLTNLTGNRTAQWQDKNYTGVADLSDIPTNTDFVDLTTAQNITGEKSYGASFNINTNFGINFGNNGTGPNNAISTLFSDLSAGMQWRLFDGDFTIRDGTTTDRFVFERTTGNLQATSFNGVALSDSGSVSNFLNEQGNYVNVSGGTSNPSIFIPTASDFISPNVLNANKTWEIQSDIDTGASNIDFTSLQGVVLDFKGGSLTGTGTITGNLTDIKGDIPDASYFSDGYTFAGTWKVTDISFNWFGLISDEESPLYNNRQALKNAMYVAGSSGHCDVNWYNDHPNSEWYVDALDFDGLIDDNINYGLYYTSYVNLKGHNFPKIHVLDNNTVPGHSLRSTIFQFFEAKHCTVSGFELIGDRQTTTYTPEHKMGIVFSNNSDYSKAFNNKIHEFTGDGIYFATQFYSGYGQIPTQTDSEWTIGAIDPVTGLLDVAQTEYMSSNAFLDIDTPLFQDRGYLYVTGRMEVENYFLSCYDATNTFLGRTDALEAYDRVYFPEGTKSVKLTMWYEATLDTDRPIKINTYDFARYVTIKDNEIYNCSRQGLSNATAYTRIYGNHFHHIFGQAAGPCAGIDLEDGGYFTAYVEIVGNTFDNNSGAHLLLKWNRHTVVKDNWFLNTDYIEDGTWTYYGNFSTGFYAQHSPGTIATGNTFIGRGAVIGRDQTFSNNYMKNTGLSIEKGSSSVHDNIGVNVTLSSVNDTYSYPGRPQFYNNHFTWDKEFNWENDSDYAFSVYGRFDERNNVYDFKGASESVARTLVIDNASLQANSGTGYIDGMKLYGYVGNSSYGFGGYGNVNISNSDFSCGFNNSVGNSTPTDLKITNTNFKNYIFLELESYDDVALPTVDDYKTVTIDGGTVLKDNGTFSRAILDVENHNFNLVIKNYTFKSIVDITAVSAIDIDNKGTLHITNCTFDFEFPESYDLANSLTSKAYVTRCTMNNFALTKRAGDEFEYNTVDGVLVDIPSGGESTSISDTSEIDLTLTGSDITADLVVSSIDETKLDASVNASLNLADTAIQQANLGIYNPSSLSNTSTLTLNSIGGERYVSTANTLTNYPTTIISSTVGAWIKLLINTTSEPTVNGVSTGKIKGATWVASTDMYMVIYTDNGTDINYYFLEK